MAWNAAQLHTSTHDNSTGPTPPQASDTIGVQAANCLHTRLAAVLVMHYGWPPRVSATHQSQLNSQLNTV